MVIIRNLYFLNGVIFEVRIRHVKIRAY